MKNALVILLVALCGGMGFVIYKTNAFEKFKSQPNMVAAPSENVTEACIPEKIDESLANNSLLDANQLVEIATVDSISLNTPISDIDGLLAKQDYNCKKDENNSTSNKAASQDISWSCSLNSEPKSKLSLKATTGKLIQITRIGPIKYEEVDKTIRYIDELKSKLLDRRGLSFSMSDRNTTLSLLAGTETEEKVKVRYSVQVNFPKDTPANASFSASLTR